MDAVVWASLLGVLLGSASTLAGQYLTIRHNSRVVKAERERVQRDEWRAAIREFLEEAQRAEARCVYRYQNGTPPPNATNDQLWLLQKLIQLSCPPEIARTSGDYTWRLDRILWEGHDAAVGDVWDDMWRAREPFLDAATTLLEYKI